MPELRALISNLSDEALQTKYKEIVRNCNPSLIGTYLPERLFEILLGDDVLAARPLLELMLVVAQTFLPVEQRPFADLEIDNMTRQKVNVQLGFFLCGAPVLGDLAATAAKNLNKLT